MHRREKFGLKNAIFGIIGFIVFCVFVYTRLYGTNTITGMDIKVTDVVGRVYMNDSSDVLAPDKSLKNRDHIVVEEGSEVEIEVVGNIKVRVKGYADFYIDELKLSETRNFQLEMNACDTKVDVLECSGKNLELATRNAIATISTPCKLRLIYIEDKDATYGFAYEGSYMLKSNGREDRPVAINHAMKVKDLVTNPVGDILEGMIMDDVNVDKEDIPELDADLYFSDTEADIIKKYSDKYGAQYMIDENNEEYRKQIEEFLKNNSTQKKIDGDN